MVFVFPILRVPGFFFFSFHLSDNDSSESFIRDCIVLCMSLRSLLHIKISESCSSRSSNPIVSCLCPAKVLLEIFH